MAIKVRGICRKCGRVVTTTAPAGTRGRPRTTWRGPCPRKGCDGTVIARRIRDEEPAPAADDKTNEPKPAKARRKVTKVSYGDHPGSPKDQPAEVQRVPRTPDDDAAGSAVAGGREPARPPADPAGAGDQPGPPAKPRRPTRAAHPESGRRRAPYDFLSW